MQVGRSEEKGVVTSPVYTEVGVEEGVLGPLFPCSLWGGRSGASELCDEVPVKASVSFPLILRKWMKEGSEVEPEKMRVKGEQKLLF